MSGATQRKPCAMSLRATCIAIAFFAVTLPFLIDNGVTLLAVVMR